jgi:acetyltransferase-like isoleucine patch superfamily enzyme
MAERLPEAALAVPLHLERALGCGVHLLKHPYPYRATLALSNDCDGMTLETFEELHRFLNTREETRFGEGLGLDVADSFWVYAPEQRVAAPERRRLSMKNGCEVTSADDLSEIVAMYAHAGWLDTLHSIGNFPHTEPRPTRAHAEAAVALFSRYGIGTPVWVDHGGKSNVQNLGRWDWALGAQPGSDCFLADLLGGLGVRFISDERVETATDLHRSERIELENLCGQELWWFARWRARRVAEMESTEGVAQVVSQEGGGDTAKLWHPTALHHQLNPVILDQVVREGLSLVVAQHLGWMVGPDGRRFRLDEYPPAALEAFRLLRRYQDDGSVLVARTSRLLGFLRAKQSLGVRVEETADGVTVDCVALQEGARVEQPTVDALRGLSFAREGDDPPRILIEGRPLPEDEVETAVLDNGAGGIGVAAIRWHPPDVRDHAETRRALARPTRTRPQPDADVIPVVSIRIDPRQLERASDRERRALVHTIERQERAGFFGREAAPEKEWAYLDLDEFPSFEDYVTRCRKVQRGAALRQARKAADRGYRSRFFNPGTHVVDLAEIDTSAPVRQGQLLGPHYFRTVEERGGYPDAAEPEVVPHDELVWNRYFGLFAEEPAHRQGEVVVGERLLAYITLRRAAELAFYGTILGHAERLREGIMYKLQLDLVEHLLAERGLLEAGADDADTSLRGLRYLLYSRFFDTEGLSQWKKKMLFRPGYFVCDYSVVDGGAEEVSSPSGPETPPTEPETSRPYLAPRAAWSDAVVGLDETARKLLLSDGELDIPAPPAAGAPLVELEVDDQMQRFLSKLLIFTRPRTKLAVSSATAVEPPVNLRGLGRIPIRIGAFSYSYSPVTWISEVGRYCSLADDISVAFVEHPTDWLSTSSFTYDTDPKGFMWRQFSEGPAGRPSGEAFVPRPKPRRERRVVLGNDVWIGSGAYLKGGVTVGDSAIVGSRAMVTKDVPPFAVVAGNPARVVRTRLPEELIDRLRRLEWWRFPYTELGGVELEDAERAVEALEERIASGRIRPYSPAWISFGWIAETAERLRRG